MPGGNPAPLVTVSWALAREGWRVEGLHAVLYGSAARWLETELLGGTEPLLQLRRWAEDPSLATLYAHLAHHDDGAAVEDDGAPASDVAMMEALWNVTVALQSGTLPVVFALVGGRRRTLTADMVVAFQLLARPQDRLVDVRVDPKDAVDPLTGFAFPEQQTPAQVPSSSGDVVSAADVRVRLVEVRVPRLRHLLPPSALASFQDALGAGEAALDARASSMPSFDLRTRVLRVGMRETVLSPDQAIWWASLALARRRSSDGWLAVEEGRLPQRVARVAGPLWHREPHELSDAWAAETPEQRGKWLGPIRSRLRREVASAFDGHPWRDQVIPELSRTREGSRERIRAVDVAWCPAMEALLADVRARAG